MMEGTRATTYDNAEALQSETSGFTCYAYTANSTTVNTDAGINGSNVKWNSTNSAWEFQDGPDPHRWPSSDDLDFFAYMPATLPSYITTGPAYPAAHTVTFSCNMALDVDKDDKEFVFALALGQNKSNAGSGVSLTFLHPFARIKLQLAASHDDITINRITFKGIKNNGSCSFDGTTSTWTPSGVATDFVLTLNHNFSNNPDTPTPIGENYIMIPQGWAGEIVVDAVCLFWGDWVNYPNLTTTIPTTWQPGHSYTYTFNISPDDLKVNVSKFTEQW